MYTREETYLATREPVSRARTLLPDAYRTQEFYDLEQDLVFRKGWVCVGYTSQVQEPGLAFLTQVGGQPLFLIRDREKRLHCFYNVCRHRGSRLISEDGKYSAIRCPYHSWTYSTAGCLQGTPYFKGLDLPEKDKKYYDLPNANGNDLGGFCKSDYGLLEAKVDTWGCFIFVNLDLDAGPLSEWLGDLPQRFPRHPLADLKLIKRKDYEVKANWKLIVENFIEYYHVPYIHPELNRVSKGNDHHRYQGPGMYMGFCTSPLTSDPSSPLESVPVMPGLDATEARSAYWIHIFPNISLFILPNHVFTLMVRPDGVGKSFEHVDLLVHESVAHAESEAECEAYSKNFEQIFQYWDLVNRQDFEAVQRVQQGLAAIPYPGGRMCHRYEEPIHRFQNILIDRMVGKHRIPEGDGELARGYYGTL